MQTQQLQVIPKHKFKAEALYYLRMVEEQKKPILVSHAGVPVVKVVPIYKKSNDEILKELGGAIKIKGDILSPVAVDDWEVLK